MKAVLPKGFIAPELRQGNGRERNSLLRTETPDHNVRSALETTGLDPAVGFLHRDRPGRPGLALDMMEEFRPFMAGRMAISMINLNQVKPEGFTSMESGFSI